jgi:hypothetical protein
MGTRIFESSWFGKERGGKVSGERTDGRGSHHALVVIDPDLIDPEPSDSNL